MIESMDGAGPGHGRSGIATRKPDGTLDYHRGDRHDGGHRWRRDLCPWREGPFDPNHAKATAYQTGVWVPLIVAGPLVNSPDREVRNMVNIADLFELFGEIAGVDVRKVVPKSHVLDSVPMLSYLSNPDQESIRKTNFTQTAINITANGERPAPCVLSITDPPTCLQVFPQQQLCQFEGGTWYGPGNPSFPAGLASCCEVQDNTVPGTYPELSILADAEMAIRNDRFKLLNRQVPNCVPARRQ